MLLIAREQVCLEGDAPTLRNEHGFRLRSHRHLQASKAYVLRLIQSLHPELAGTGDQVLAVLPGVTRIEILDPFGIDTWGIPAERVMETGR